MEFSGLSFLFLFLPAALLLNFLAPNKLKNAVLILSSLVFYFLGERLYTELLLFVSVFDYVCALAREKNRENGRGRLLLAVSVLINAAALIIFRLFAPAPGAVFIVLTSLSYLAEVFRGRPDAEKSLSCLLTYICMFPKLIFGPIARYGELSDELHNRKPTRDRLYSGVLRFVTGLGKTAIIANILSDLCDSFLASGDRSVAFYWLYAPALALTVYYQLSGYGDMAVGLGRVLGFSLPENFDYPLTAGSITDFTRRWHMSLVAWFRDYLYLPLLGKGGGKLRRYLLIVPLGLLFGLCYGTGLNYLICGLLFGLLLLLERLFLSRLLGRLGPVLPRLYTLLIVMAGALILNAGGLNGALGDLGGLFGAKGLPFMSFEGGYYAKSYLLALIVAVLGATPLPKRLWARLAGIKALSPLTAVIEPLFVLAVLGLSAAFLMDGGAGLIIGF
jgi:alginate O-acetyltransferase complex protein AlgI